MKRLLFSAIVVFIFFSCEKSPVVETDNAGPGLPWTDTSTRHPKNAAFISLLNKYVQKGLPGVSMLVNDANGTWVGSAGKADIERNIGFKPGTIGKVASITKLFMGSLTFKLMEDSLQTGIGYKDLNMPVSKWISKEITDKLPNGNLITLGQCMRHETGIPDVINENAFRLSVLNNPVKKWTAEELLEFIYKKQALFFPGEKAGYSNTNFILVSMVLERATGKKHGDLLKQYVLQPLKLNNTYYQPYDILPGYMAQGYFDLYQNNTIVNVTDYMPGSGNGYEGISSNLPDMFTFINALLVNKTFLNSTSLAIMQTFGKAEVNIQYGYAMEKNFINRGTNAGYGHAGRDLGYMANLYYFPNRGVTHAFLINYGPDTGSNLKEVFHDFQEELLDLTLR
jgi:D-alanyl-D-alanine carboxypeptidase